MKLAFFQKKRNFKENIFFMQNWDTPQLVEFVLTVLGSLIAKAKEEGKELANEPAQVIAALATPRPPRAVANSADTCLYATVLVVPSAY